MFENEHGMSSLKSALDIPGRLLAHTHACTQCVHGLPLNVFSCASPSRAEAQSTALVRNPASATRSTTYPWPPWSHWTPCLTWTRPRDSPAAPGSVPVCRWCDPPTRRRTAHWVGCVESVEEKIFIGLDIFLVGDLQLCFSLFLKITRLAEKFLYLLCQKLENYGSILNLKLTF